jgi:hypothetical protein
LGLEGYNILQKHAVFPSGARRTGTFRIAPRRRRSPGTVRCGRQEGTPQVAALRIAGVAFFDLAPVGLSMGGTDEAESILPGLGLSGPAWTVSRPTPSGVGCRSLGARNPFLGISARRVAGAGTPGKTVRGEGHAPGSVRDRPRPRNRGRRPSLKCQTTTPY